MGSPSRQNEERVLVVAPTARDAQLSQALFAQAGLSCAICQDLAAFGAELARGVGVVVLTEEALLPGRQQLLAALSAQPTWSSLPVIVLAGARHRQLLTAPLVQQLGNILVLERPISSHTLLNVVRMELRARRRQYQARLVVETGLLLTASLSDEGTLAAVVALLAPRLADCCLLHTRDGEVWRVAAMSFAAEAEYAGARLSAVLAGATQEERPPPAASVPGDAPALSRSTGAAAAIALAQSHLEIVGAAEHLVVPLEAHGQLLGVLSLGMLTATRTFLADDRQVVEEVAGRLALALNQARLYHAEQAARAEAEAAVRSRDELMALISHDLNNPLTVVLGQAQLLQRQLTRDAPAAERLLQKVATIGRAARQMQAQIAELLDAARLLAGQPLEVRREVTDLVALTQAVVTIAQQGTERHQLSVTTPLPALVAPLDPLRVERVLDNLLSNAVKYSPAGGSITVAGDVEGTGGGAWAVVQVRDQGIGIPAADLPHVFERFRRASNVTPTMRGMGLGLASVHQIVAQHGGRISVASPAEGGTLVTIHLPLGNGAR
jgi:signal transduction histidine kinase